MGESVVMVMAMVMVMDESSLANQFLSLEFHRDSKKKAVGSALCTYAAAYRAQTKP